MDYSLARTHYKCFFIALAFIVACVSREYCSDCKCAYLTGFVVCLSNSVWSAHQLVAKMVFNGFYLPFMVWGQFWAPQFRLVSLQYPHFSNLQMCFSFWKVTLTMVVYGSVRVKATLRFISGGSEYTKMGLSGPFFVFLVSTIIPWRISWAICARRVLCENSTALRSCLKLSELLFFNEVKILSSKESIFNL